VKIGLSFVRCTFVYVFFITAVQVSLCQKFSVD